MLTASSFRLSEEYELKRQVSKLEHELRSMQTNYEMLLREVISRSRLECPQRPKGEESTVRTIIDKCEPEWGSGSPIGADTACSVWSAVASGDAVEGPAATPVPMPPGRTRTRRKQPAFFLFVKEKRDELRVGEFCHTADGWNGCLSWSL